MNILIVVDMQNDFVNGCLGTPEAREIVPAVVDKVKNWDGAVLFTRDTHFDNYLETQEGKNLPVLHCIQGTHGWDIIDELKPFVTEDNTFDKPTFGSTRLMEYFNLETDCIWSYNSDFGGLDIESITLIGVCTDICVISNAMLLKAEMPEVPIIVDAYCCAGVTPISHTTALNAMRACQIRIENSMTRAIKANREKAKEILKNERKNY
jgi:nicotinamidase-related amidase